MKLITKISTQVIPIAINKIIALTMQGEIRNRGLAFFQELNRQRGLILDVALDQVRTAYELDYLTDKAALELVPSNLVAHVFPHLCNIEEVQEESDRLISTTDTIAQTESGMLL